MPDINTPIPLTALADICRREIHAAESRGVAVTDWNVDRIVDHVADITNAPLSDIRAALVVAGFAARFPYAIASKRLYRDVI